MSKAARILEDYLRTFPKLEELEPFMHDEIEFETIAPNGRLNKGKERILGGLIREFEKFYRRDSFDLQILDVFGDQTRAACRYRIVANTRLGPYENDYCITVEIEDGKIRRGWEYSDTARAGEQIGEAWRKMEAERKARS